MTVSLDGVDAKIARARQHLDELKAEVSTAFGEGSYEFVKEVDGPGRLSFRVRGVPKVDPLWNVTTGEILFNLRSSLDHLAWQLVLLDNGQPGEETYFPIHLSALNKKGKPRNLTIQPHVSATALKLLTEVQPYSRSPHPEFHQLQYLHDLNRIDKHRLLLVITCVLDTDQVWWGLPGEVPTPRVRVRPGPLTDEDTALWFDFGTHTPPPDFDPHPALTIKLAEGPPDGPFRKNSLTNSLDLIRYYVQERVVDHRFRPLFAL